MSNDSLRDILILDSTVMFALKQLTSSRRVSTEQGLLFLTHVTKCRVVAAAKLRVDSFVFCTVT